MKQTNVLLSKAVVVMHFINIASEIVFKHKAKEEIHKVNVLYANWYGKYKMNKKYRIDINIFSIKSLNTIFFI